MPTIILAYDTALAFWSNPILKKANVRPISIQQADKAMRSAATSLRDIPDGLFRHGSFAHLPKQLHLLSSKAEAHRRGQTLIVHTLMTGLPDGALVYSPELSASGIDVLVSSPEYCFVQMGQLMCKQELIELGFELCGDYSVMPDSKHGIVDRAAVTTPDRIRDFLLLGEQMPGIKRARQASKWILPNSRSSKESQLAMLLFISRTCGGRGIPAPELNHRFCVSGDAARVLGGRECYPDLYWPEISMVVEYDSKDRHDTWSVADRDSRKRNVYKMLGLEVITLTYSQMANYLAFESLANEIERAFRLYRNPASERQKLAQRKLHGFLLHAQRHPRYTDLEFLEEGFS